VKVFFCLTPNECARADSTMVHSTPGSDFPSDKHSHRAIDQAYTRQTGM